MFIILQFNYILESHVVECSMESFMHTDFRSTYMYIIVQ